MNTFNINEMIEQYFDRELEKNKEPMLFTLLGSDSEAREYFKKMNLLQTSFQIAADEYPEALDEKILKKIEKVESKKYTTGITHKIFTAVAYSFSIILLAASIFFYSKSEEYKVQFVDLTREVKKQNEQINLLLNTLPQVDVQGSYVRTKTVVVRPQS